MSDYRNVVFYGRDCTIMREIPDESVQCVVTSPPYFGLRKYEAGSLEIGRESELKAYIYNLLTVFDEIKRVLRPDGTVWLNLGDSYATNCASGAQGETGDRKTRTFTASELPARKVQGVKTKSLIGVPWRVAIALQEDGWIIRNDIIWAKPNPMPSSARDRCTPSHEHVFLLAKNPKYYYDADAIREPLADASVAALKNGDQIKFGGTKAQGYGKASYSGRTWGERKASGAPTRHGVAGAAFFKDNNFATNPSGANKRDVWVISPKPFKGEHFAVMPWDLVDTCIRAGSKPGDLILDPFMGSGTVAAVSKALGRDYVGYDLNPDYERFLEPRIAEIAKKYEAKIDSAA